MSRAGERGGDEWGGSAEAGDHEPYDADSERAATLLQRIDLVEADWAPADI